MESQPSNPPNEPADARFSLRTLLVVLAGVSAVLALCKLMEAPPSLSFVVTVIITWALLQHRLPKWAWLASYLAMATVVGLAAIAAHFGV